MELRLRLRWQKKHCWHVELAASTSRRRKSRRRNISSSSSYDLIFAMVALLLCTSSLHQSVLAVKITDNADDTRTRSNNGNGNGIQRKRGGGGAKRESLQEQFQRITNHRRLDRQHHQQGRQQQLVNGPPLSSSHSRTLHDDTMMCTCSPQIFNIKITLTSTDPCSTDDLKPNNGIENTLCLFTNPTEPGLYPPVPAPVPVEETTMQPTATAPDTNDPFRPPSGSGGSGSGATMPPKPGFPTYSPTSSTYAPTITGMPITPFPSFVPTKSDDDERMAQKRPDSGGGGGRQSSGSGGEPTYHPTIPWPTFSPTTNPTPYSDDDNDSGGAEPRGGRGGWLDEAIEEEDGMPSLRSMSLDDDDELIEPHHHRHHHHIHSSTFTEDENNGGSRKLESSASGRKRMLQVINVDDLVHDSGVIMSGKDNKDGAIKDDNEDDSNFNKGKDVKPSYYQPPAAAVHQSTLDTWTSIPPNDVFFYKHPELKLYQEELYRMKHGLPSSSSKSTSTSTSAVASSVTTRSLQGQVQGGLMPTRLISAQFLEMDTSSNMQIINQDDQYLNVTFPDPSNIVLQFHIKPLESGNATK